MAHIDKENLFSDAQALTATAASTNLIDLKAASRLFEGEPMVVVFVVDVAADFTTTDETYQFDLESDALAAFGSATVIASRTILAASLTAGSQHTLPVPVEIDAESFIRMNFTLAGTTPSITVTAWLSPQSLVQKDRIYPKGYTIS